jgi:hypothetical protein
MRIFALGTRGRRVSVAHFDEWGTELNGNWLAGTKWNGGAGRATALQRQCAALPDLMRAEGADEFAMGLA